MSEQVLVSQDDLLSSLERLRSEDTQRLGPVRLHYLQALAQRMLAAPDKVQILLQAKLQQALAELGPAPLQSVPELVPEQALISRPKDSGAPAPGPATPLGRLNQHIAEASLAGESGGASEGGPRRELRSALRFRETWALISAETEVDQAVHRGPENAGPLNSHSLMLRTLGLMRELSPDYLRCFLAHSDTLLWLEQAYGELKQPAGKGKPVKAGKQKK